MPRRFEAILPPRRLGLVVILAGQDYPQLWKDLNCLVVLMDLIDEYRWAR